MPIEEAPPAAIALLVLVALLLFVATPAWLIWAARNWAWPKGYERTFAFYMGHRCTLLYNDAMTKELILSQDDLHKLARAGARAAWAVNQAAEDANIDVDGKLRHVVLVLLTDEDFDGDSPREAEDNAKRNGYLWKIGKRVTGDYLPMIVARSKFYAGVLARGTLTVHELTHEVAKALPNVKFNDGWMHEDARLWEHLGGHTIEARARAHYIDSKEI